MKINKIHSEIIKAHFKNKPFPLANAKGMIATSYDQYHLYLIPEKDFLLDPVKLGRDVIPDYTFMFNDLEESRPAYMTGNIKINEKGWKLAEIKNVDGISVYINLDYMKNFDKDCKFRFKTSTQTIYYVYVFEGDDLAGFICPVRGVK